MRRAAFGSVVALVALVAFVFLMILAVPACNRADPPAARETTAATPSSSEPRSDSALTTAVQAKFYGDNRVRGQDIDVSTENGVVTLRGAVPTETAKQQAVNLARGVEGVTSVNDEIGVRAAQSTRAETQGPTTATGTAGRNAEPRQPWWITTKIQAQYFVDPDVKPWNVDVTTSTGGVVTLEGTVDSATVKAEAVRIARETEGVTLVEDRLRVQPEAALTDATRKSGNRGIDHPDPWLTAKVQAKYFIDDEVKARNIDVDTRSGVVTLNGSVGSEAERRQAVALARSTDGVRDVVDNLRIDVNVSSGSTDTASGTVEETAAAKPADRADLKRPDGWITTKIQSKYFLDTDVKGHEIDVDTRNGVVTLKGRVATAQQKQEAEQMARETEGVERVVNQLTVGG